MFKSYGVEQIGMSMLLVIMQVSKMLFDLPSGFLADKYGRRNMFVVGQILRMSLFTMWAVIPCFESFVIGVIMWGSSMSCFYGNVEAYNYDVLKINDSAKDFPKFMGRYYAIQNVSISIACYLSGYLFDFGSYRLILLASVIPIAGSTAMCLTMPNYKLSDRANEATEQVKDAATTNAPKEIFVLKAFKTFFGNKSVRFYAVLSAVNDAMFIFLLDLNTTTMSNLGFLESNVAKVVGIMGFVRIAANLCAGYTTKWLTPRKNIIIMLILFVCLAYTGYKYNNWLVATIVLYLVIYAFLDLAIKTNVQTFISSDMRATIMSIASFFVSVFAVSLNLSNGIISHFFSNRISIVSIGIFLSSLMLFLLYKNIIATHGKRVVRKQALKATDVP